MSTSSIYYSNHQDDKESSLLSKDKMEGKDLKPSLSHNIMHVITQSSSLITNEVYHVKDITSNNLELTEAKIEVEDTSKISNVDVYPLKYL